MIDLTRKHPFNKKIHSITITVTLSLFLSFFSKAQEIRSFGLENMGRQLTYVEDKTATLSLKDVQQLHDKAFKKGEQQILNFGNTSSAWWIKINYLSQPDLALYLLIDAPNIEYITAYATDAAGKTIKYQTGSLERQSPNVRIGNNFMLNLPVTDSATHQTIYLRLKSNNILLAPIKLSTADIIMARPPLSVGIEYIYMGLLIGLLLYNLFLFFSIRDITYLYYVLYVFTLSGYILMYLRGYAFVFGDDFRIFFNEHPHAFMGLSLITLLIFSSKFLHLETLVPKFRRFFYALGSFGILLTLLSILGFKNISSTLTQYLSFITALAIWVAGIMAYRNGHKPAKYFIIAWFLIWVSTVIVTFSLGGLIVQNELTIQLVPLSTIMELLLLSFALGDRYKAIMQAEQRLRDENLQLITTQNQRLEERVNERTRQLSSTVNALEESNTIKNKLFSIIAHDLKSPLNSLTGILSLNDMKALSPDELRMLLAENKKTIDSISNTLNNLLHWAKGQMEGMVTEDGNFDLSILLEEQILLYMPLIKKKEIQIERHIEYDGPVAADQNQINLVLRNLTDNAIKFTPVGGKIVFMICRSEASVLFSIENEVPHSNEIMIDNLRGEKMATSTFGTQNERGVGLGLLLCHEYVRNNGSVLHPELNGNRIKFSFQLPMAGLAE
ncbi:Adaptive-response sensory-kinase SasA [compost metagenome]